MAKLLFRKAKCRLLTVKGVEGLFCSNCGARRQEGYKNCCFNCGVKLEHPQCKECGSFIKVNMGFRTDNWGDDEYCTTCGEKLPRMIDFLKMAM